MPLWAVCVCVCNVWHTRSLRPHFDKDAPSVEIAHTIFVIIPKCVRERACFYYHWLCARGYLHTQSNTKHTNTRTHTTHTEIWHSQQKRDSCVRVFVLVCCFEERDDVKCVRNTYFILSPTHTFLQHPAQSSSTARHCKAPLASTSRPDLFGNYRCRVHGWYTSRHSIIACICV